MIVLFPFEVIPSIREIPFVFRSFAVTIISMPQSDAIFATPAVRSRRYVLRLEKRHVGNFVLIPPPVVTVGNSSRFWSSSPATQESPEAGCWLQSIKIRRGARRSLSPPQPPSSRRGKLISLSLRCIDFPNRHGR